MIDTGDIGEIHRFVDKVDRNLKSTNDFQELSRGAQVDEIARSLARQAVEIMGVDDVNRSENSFQRDLVVGVGNAMLEMRMFSGIEQQSLVESRIYKSEILALFYLIAGDRALEEVRKKVEAENLDEDAMTPEEKRDWSWKLKDMTAEVCVRYLKNLRGKNEESEIAEIFPNAPTSGFEMEYFDPVSFIRLADSRIKWQLEILEHIRDDGDQVIENLKKVGSLGSVEEIDYLYENAALSDDDLRSEISVLAGIQKKLRLTRTSLYRWETGQLNPGDLMRDVRLFALAEDSKKIPETDLEKIRTLLSFIAGLQPINPGDELKDEEVALVSDLSPTLTGVMSMSGAYKDEVDLTERELITKPSYLKTQLRDLLHVLLTDGLEGQVGVHQTVSGAVLNENNIDFMEVLAMEGAADLLPGQKKFTEKEEAIIDRGGLTGTESYQKCSKGTDGEAYYFPLHHNRGFDSKEAEKYVGESQNLLELRGVGNPNLREDFMKFVREATFNWVAAWGSSADNKPESERTEDEKYFAESWQTMLAEWRELLVERGVKRPENSKYFCKWEERSGGGKNREEYTEYAYSLRLRQQREAVLVQQGDMKYEDTLEAATKKIMIRYRAKIMGRVGGRIKEFKARKIQT